MIQLPNINGINILFDLTELCNQFPGKVVFTTSFSMEDQVITDIICSNQLPVKIITLDTGRIFEETYNVFSRTLNRYKIEIETLHPDATELSELLKKKGPFSFYESLENRKECCTIRKVKPMKKAITCYSLWITGIRSEQSETRAKLEHIEFDESYNIIKYSPLLNWSFGDVRNYVSKNNVPYNVMHERGFPSIGCAPCTRAVPDGEDVRSGRWWWENNSKKECGLHSI